MLKVAMAAKTGIKIVDDYVASVLAGRIPVNQLVRQAVERHQRDLETGAARGLRFDAPTARRALAFFGVLRHSKGEWAGRPFKLEPWQQFVLAVIFGWLREDGTRRFRHVYIELPRKNGKSTLIAGIGLYLFLADGEPGAEVYAAATKRDQARIVHSEAIRMVKASPVLRKEAVIFRDNLNVPTTNSKFEPLGADSDTMDGLNIHGAIVDELHAHKTRGVVDVLVTAVGSRRQPLIVEITTAGWDRKSVCWEHHDYTRQVVEKLVEDDAWFGFVAGIDEGDDWADPKVWIKANPNYGVSVKPDDLKRLAERAKRIPAEQNAFKRLRLCVWTEQTEVWLDMVEWDACGVEPVDLDDLAGRKCYAGLDLADTTDIAALVLDFPEDDDLPADEAEQAEAAQALRDAESGLQSGSEPDEAAPAPDDGADSESGAVEPVRKTTHTLVAWFWVPEGNLIERARKTNVPYLSWVEQGLMQATEGNVIDYAAIRAKLDELAQHFEIVEVAYDRWGSTQMVQWMQDGGLEVVPFGQGFASMSPAAKEFVNLLLARRLRHGGNIILRWMAGNAVVRSDPAGNIKPDKSKSSGKIDGIVAAIMAVDRATRHANTESVYETRGLLVV